LRQPCVATVCGEVRRHDANLVVHFARDRQQSRAPSTMKSQPRVRFVTASATIRRNETRRHANQF
jgi:hypothetical protein